jgi:glyceraldehyde-3-phosphate dehydrogenase (NADP+)
MTVGARIEAVQAFVAAMRKVREESVRLLMWEIGKTRGDSEKEFDRTVQYLLDTVETLKEMDRSAGRFTKNSGILAQIRRSPLGVVLCMGPFNYPLNETFTTLIPAIIMGNTVVAKLPRFGMLCQAPLLKAFAEAFPRGVVNIINGDGRVVAGPIMESGEVAAMAFIGSSRVANILKKQHPRPNRLRCILGLDAKNPALILPDADVDLAVQECLAGALTFNGQRCTALKLLLVHRSIAERFVRGLADAVDALPFGLPWEPGVKLTPMPEENKAETMSRLVGDAVSKGARVANRNGGLANRTFYFPSVVFPVDARMELWTVEQFGPAVPVAVYDEVGELLKFAERSNYGQQASIFGRDPKTIGALVDALANQVCRVNLNAQCQRGPDVYPFTGRKDSAEATLSVSDALRCFSIRSMVAAPESDLNRVLLRDLLNGRTSNFVNTDYIF